MPFLYVGNLGLDYDQDAIEKDFTHFGTIRESWHWPTFGYCFFEYDSHRDAEDALKEMNGSKSADGKSMAVQWARRPRKHLPSRATNNDKCYICNRYGHFARDCPDIGTSTATAPRSRYRGGGGGGGSRRGDDRRGDDRRGDDRRGDDRRGDDRRGSPSRGRDSSPRRRSRSPRRKSRSKSPYNRRSPDRRSRSPYNRRERTERSFSRSPVRRSRS